MYVPDTLEEFAEEFAGNWMKFESFVWHDEPEENSEDWGIYYTHNRDSGILDTSNYEVIRETLKKYTEWEGDDKEPTAIEEHHGHWAVGWIDGFSILVYDKDRNITPACEELYNILKKMEDYPLLDEDDYYTREYEATIENIIDCGSRYIKVDAPDDWPYQVFSYFWDNDQSEVENRDDQGGYPSDEGMKNALKELNMLDEEYLNEEEDYE